MGKYVEKNLRRDENIELKAKKNPLALIPKFIWAAVWIALAIALPLLLTSVLGINH